MRQFDWPLIRASYERGLTPNEIVKQLPNMPSRHAVEKRAKREGWEVAQLPNQEPGYGLTGTDATKAVVLSKIQKGVPLGLAAQSAGISPRTLYNWRENDSSFAEMLTAARASFIARKIEQVDEAGERDWKAASYLIERAPETRDEFGATKSDTGLTIVLQIDRSQGVTIDSKRIDTDVLEQDQGSANP